MSFTNERNTVESAVRETVVFDEDQNDGLYPGLSRPGLSLRQSLSRPLSASRARLINETPEKRAERLARMRAYSKRRREMKKQGDGNSGDLDLNSSMSDQVDFQDVQIEQCDLDMNEQDFEDQQLYLEEIRQRESERADEVGGEKERKEDESFSQARVAGSHSDRGESHQQAFSSASAGGDYHTASSGDHPAAFESSSESRMPPHGSVSADAPIEKPPRKRAYKSKKRSHGAFEKPEQVYQAHQAYEYGEHAENEIDPSLADRGVLYHSDDADNHYPSRRVYPDYADQPSYVQRSQQAYQHADDLQDQQQYQQPKQHYQPQHHHHHHQQQQQQQGERGLYQSHVPDSHQSRLSITLAPPSQHVAAARAPAPRQRKPRTEQQRQARRAKRSFDGESPEQREFRLARMRAYNHRYTHFIKKGIRVPASDSAAAAAAPEESKPAAPPVGKTPSAKDYFDNRTCAVCQMTGHNRRTCPTFLAKKAEALVQFNGDDRKATNAAYLACAKEMDNIRPKPQPGEAGYVEPGSEDAQDNGDNDLDSASQQEEEEEEENEEEYLETPTARSGNASAGESGDAPPVHPGLADDGQDSVTSGGSAAAAESDQHMAFSSEANADSNADMPRGPRKCRHCGGLYHDKRTCPLLNAQRSSFANHERERGDIGGDGAADIAGALPGTGGIQCSLCKGVGHERAMCPELRTNSDPPTMVGRGGSGDVRVADNRVPSRFHVTNGASPSTNATSRKLLAPAKQRCSYCKQRGHHRSQCILYLERDERGDARYRRAEAVDSPDDMPGDFSSPSGANNHRSSPLALAGSDQPAELMDATGTAALKQPKMDQSDSAKRQCAYCKGSGHDRRNCPVLHPKPHKTNGGGGGEGYRQPPPPPPPPAQPALHTTKKAAAFRPPPDMSSELPPLHRPLAGASVHAPPPSSNVHVPKGHNVRHTILDGSSVVPAERRCSQCKEYGHNRRSCDKRPKLNDMAGVVGTDGDIRGGHAAGGQLLDDYDTAASLDRHPGTNYHPCLMCGRYGHDKRACPMQYQKAKTSTSPASLEDDGLDSPSAHPMVSVFGLTSRIPRPVPSHKSTLSRTVSPHSPSMVASEQRHEEEQRSQQRPQQQQQHQWAQSTKRPAGSFDNAAYSDDDDDDDDEEVRGALVIDEDMDSNSCMDAAKTTHQEAAERGVQTARSAVEDAPGARKKTPVGSRADGNDRLVEALKKELDDMKSKLAAMENQVNARAHSPTTGPSSLSPTSSGRHMLHSPEQHRAGKPYLVRNPIKHPLLSPKSSERQQQQQHRSAGPNSQSPPRTLLRQKVLARQSGHYSPLASSKMPATAATHGHGASTSKLHSNRPGMSMSAASSHAGEASQHAPHAAGLAGSASRAASITPKKVRQDLREHVQHQQEREWQARRLRNELEANIVSLEKDVRGALNVKPKVPASPSWKAVPVAHSRYVLQLIGMEECVSSLTNPDAAAVHHQPPPPAQHHHNKHQHHQPVSVPVQNTPPERTCSLCGSGFSPMWQRGETSTLCMKCDWSQQLKSVTQEYGDDVQTALQKAARLEKELAGKRARLAMLQKSSLR